MQHSVTKDLSYGDQALCTGDDSGRIAVVHACKEPCHRLAVGYAGRGLPRTHPHYLVLERGHHLYLNMVDSDRPLFMLPTFIAFLAFVDKHIAHRKVIIHCNRGESRAPSLAMLYMAKRLQFPADADSYAGAAEAFRTWHPYQPSRGISMWLARHWAMIT